MTSGKRGLSSSLQDQPNRIKRPRSWASSHTELQNHEACALRNVQMGKMVDEHQHAFSSLQRCIAQVLRYDGFDAATSGSLQDFANLVETYLQSLIENVKTTALAARREQPTPLDFEHTLKCFNLPVHSLKPHLRHDFRDSWRRPQPRDAFAQASHTAEGPPLLSEELSGKHDKAQRLYVPPSFPDFPSRHTYSFTPQEDVILRNTRTTREEMARSAQQGEDALRRLVRASKMRKQKEIKSLVERDEQGKERFRLWQLTMRRLMEGGNKIDGDEQEGVSDHSMVVNGDAQFSRKDPPKVHKRHAVFHKSLGQC